MTRPTLRQLIERGELARLFSQLGSWAAVARHLGVGERTLRQARQDYRHPDKNIAVPIRGELTDEQAAGIERAWSHETKPTVHVCADDFSDEERTGSP